MKRKKEIIKVVVFILMILTIGFIFYNSLLDGAKSSEVSTGFYETIKPILDKVVPNKYNNEAFIRKLAHFSEFGALGLELAYLFNINKKIKNVTSVMFFGLITAVSDETIQLSSYARGSSVKDVWIDFAGVLVAIIFYSLISIITKYFKKETI